MVEQELRLAQAEFVYSGERGANRALTLAGLTLAPERSELADPTLARLLLSEAFVRAVGAITAAELASTSEALVALAACDALPARFKQGGLTHARELEANTPL